MEKRKCKIDINEKETKTPEMSLVGVSENMFNLNNGNSAQIDETKFIYNSQNNFTLEKPFNIDAKKVEGWKINQISGDDINNKIYKENKVSKSRNSKIFSDHTLKAADLNSTSTHDAPNLLTKAPFNYSHQSSVTSFLNKKFGSQSNFQGDQEVLRRTMAYLHKNWLQQTMCDALIGTEDGDILTHQIILAAHSPTLETIFEKSKKPLPQLIQISMTDYSKDIVSDILNYLYTSNLKIDCKNIASLITISRQLDFPDIINKCGLFLTKNYNHDNVFLHFSVAANNHMRNSKNYLLKVIALNFSLLSQHNHFLYIPYQRLLQIISHESLAAENLEVLLALIKWFDFNRNERIQYSESLFSKVKFENIDPETIANQVEIHDWLFSTKSNKNFISQAYKYHALAALESNKSVKNLPIQNDVSFNETKDEKTSEIQANNNNIKQCKEKIKYNLKKKEESGEITSKQSVSDLSDFSEKNEIRSYLSCDKFKICETFEINEGSYTKLQVAKEG